MPARLASVPTADRTDSSTARVAFAPVDGKRSTSATGRAIVAAAAAAADAELAARIERTTNWRSDYVGCFRELTAVTAASPDVALGVAAAGLEAMRERMLLGEQPLREPLGRADRYGTTLLRGEGSALTELVVPYRGRELRGTELLEQCGAWVERGIAEPSFAAAIARVVEHPEWLRLDDRLVTVVGAGSEMGPLRPLLAWGVDVLAVDLPSRPIWERVARWARERAGTLRAPVAATETGADLVATLPAVRRWLEREAGDRPLVLGIYAYADGAAHVEVTAAADALATALLADRPDTALAWLATPTDAFVVPDAVVAAARSGRRALLGKGVRALTGSRLFAAGYAAGPVADVLVPQQGPNYALAKRLQRWRGVTSAAAGHTVSFNVAPATLTRSVTKNRVLAAAYAGAHHFGIEILRPETTRVLMAALLVHDLHVPGPASRGEHPEALFSDAAMHGGLWRSPYDPRTVLPVAAVAGLPRALRP